MINHSRRTVVTSGAAAGSLLLAGPWLDIAVPEALAQTSGRRGRLAQGIRVRDFRFAIHGMTRNLIGVQKVSGGRLSMNVRANARGRPGEQLYYAGHSWEDLTFTVQQAPGMTKLQRWCEQAMKSGGRGDALRRDCSLYLLARDKSAVLRTINYFGCYPTSCNAGDHSINSELKIITFTCKVDRIEETKG